MTAGFFQIILFILVIHINATIPRYSTSPPQTMPLPNAHVLDATWDGLKTIISGPNRSLLIFYVTEHNSNSDKWLNLITCPTLDCIDPTDSRVLFSISSHPFYVMINGSCPLIIADLTALGETHFDLVQCNDPLCELLATPIRQDRVASDYFHGDPMLFAIDPNGLPWIFRGKWYSADTSYVLVPCDSVNCSDFNDSPYTVISDIPFKAAGPNTEGSASINGHYGDMKFKSDGSAVVVLVKAPWTSGELYSYVCANSNCSTGTLTLLVNDLSTSYDKFSVQLLILPNDLPRVLYMNATKHLNMITCQTLDCSVATVVTPLLSATLTYEWPLSPYGIFVPRLDSLSFPNTPVDRLVFATIETDFTDRGLRYCDDPWCTSPRFITNTGSEYSSMIRSHLLWDDISKQLLFTYSDRFTLGYQKLDFQQSCQPGTFANPNTSLCTVCPSESFAVSASNDSFCTSCTTSPTCTPPCTANSTCDVAIYNPLCEAGHYLNTSDPNLPYCLECPLNSNCSGGYSSFECHPGYFKESSNCSPCPSNFFCPGGKLQKTCNSNYFHPYEYSETGGKGWIQNQTQCFSCPPFSTCSGSSQIPDCIDGYYFSEDNICLECPPGADCSISCSFPFCYPVCAPGYYASKGEITFQNHFGCEKCPPGAVCPGKTNSSAALAQKGFYKSPAGLFFECSPPDRCAGDNKCAPGATGQLCAFCKTGYYSLMQRCQKCYSTDILGLFYFGIILALFIFVIVILVKVRKGQKNSSIPLIVEYVQTTALIGSLSFDQIPFGLQSFFGILSLTNLSSDAAAPECLGSWSASSAFRLTISMPFIFIGFLFVIWCFHLVIFSLQLSQTIPSSEGTVLPNPKLKSSINLYLGAFNLFLLFTFIPILKASSDILACYDPGDGSLVQQSKAYVDCQTSEHIFDTVIAVLCLLVLGAILPLLLIYKLSKDFNFQDEDMILKYGSFFQRYSSTPMHIPFFGTVSPQVFGEFLSSIRKLFFVLAATLFNRQPTVSLVLFFIFSLLTAIGQHHFPLFSFDVLNKILILNFGTLVFLATVGFYLTLMIPEEFLDFENASNYLAVLFIISFTFTLLLSLFMSVHHARSSALKEEEREPESELANMEMKQFSDDIDILK